MKNLPATAQTFFTKKGTFLSSEGERTHGSVIGDDGIYTNYGAIYDAICDAICDAI